MNCGAWLCSGRGRSVHVHMRMDCCGHRLPGLEVRHG
jgi:hypothetical protein